MDESIDDPWVLSEGETSDGIRFLSRWATRYRNDEPFREKHPIRIGIAFPFCRRLRPRHGLKLEAIEEKVASAAGNRARLVGVITTSKMREFVLYAVAQDWVPGYREELARTFPKLEVQMFVAEDPGWQVYDEFNATR